MATEGTGIATMDMDTTDMGMGMGMGITAITLTAGTTAACLCIAPAMAAITGWDIRLMVSHGARTTRVVRSPARWDPMEVWEVTATTATSPTSHQHLGSDREFN